jgi:hypothetical protein
MPTDTQTPSLKGTCHCGAVRIALPFAPEKATSCNCSICRRIAGLWAYYEIGSVVVEGHPEHTDAYVWGDMTIRTIRCKTCGIATHWEPLDPQQIARQGVNINNFEPALVQAVTVQHLDGADTWAFLD